MNLLKKALFVLSTALLPMALMAEGGEYHVEELTSENAQELTSEGLVIVDFYAEWCGPCRRFAPVFTEWAGEAEGQVIAYKANVDLVADFSVQNRVRYIPTVILFSNGTAVANHTGPMSKEQLTEMIAPYVQ